jgi:hypothetical protein
LLETTFSAKTQGTAVTKEIFVTLLAPATVWTPPFLRASLAQIPDLSKGVGVGVGSSNGGLVDGKGSGPTIQVTLESSPLGFGFQFSTVNEGLLLTNVAADGAAYKGGLRENHVVTRINGVSIAGIPKMTVGSKYVHHGLAHTFSIL